MDITQTISSTLLGVIFSKPVKLKALFNVLVNSIQKVSSDFPVKS